jgi:hypothetical protein
LQQSASVPQGSFPTFVEQAQVPELQLRVQQSRSPMQASVPVMQHLSE